jgi:hypothetical protein
MLGLGLGLGLGSGRAGNSLPSPAFTLRADSGITKDGSDLVSAWAPSVGSGSVIQPASGSQPTWISSDAGFNNHPVVSFDGSTDYIFGAFSSAIASGSFTIIAVASLAAGMFIIDGIDGTNRGAIYNNSGPITSYLASAAANLSSGVTAVATGAHVIAAKFGSGANESSIAVDQATAQATATGGAAGLAGLTLGAQYAAVALGQTKIAEVRVYAVDLSASERLAIMQELGTRYGVTVGA